MSESKGIAQTQVTSGAVSSGSGSLAITSAPAVIPAASTLNISTEGGRDWVVLPANVGQQDEFDVSVWHWKFLDGWMRKSFKFYFPASTVTIAANATSTLAITSNHLDDGHVSGAAGADDLTANTTGVVLTANTAIPFTGFGWQFTAPARKVLRTLKIYFAFSPGGGVAAGQVTITARLSDGSAGDVSTIVSNIAAGLQWYKMTIQFKAGETGAYLSVGAQYTTYGDSGSRIGFQAASLN